MKPVKEMKCTVCGTELEVPLCCNEDMQLQDDQLICSLCNAKESIPICCNKKVAVNY